MRVLTTHAQDRPQRRVGRVLAERHHEEEHIQRLRHQLRVLHLQQRQEQWQHACVHYVSERIRTTTVQILLRLLRDTLRDGLNGEGLCRLGSLLSSLFSNLLRSLLR